MSEKKEDIMELLNLQELVEINKKGKLIKNDGVTHLGRGVNLNDVTKVMDISINDADRSGHFGCFGTTRVGKTRLIENIIEQDIRKGYNVVVIDPKGDIDLFSKIVQVAAESGRLEEVMMLTPIFPDHSICVDPLAYYYMEEELVEHVVSGIKAKEDYFIAIAQEVSQAVVSGLALKAQHENKKMNINFLDVKIRSDWHNLKKFRDELRLYTNCNADLILSMDQILSSPPDFFSKVSSSLQQPSLPSHPEQRARLSGKVKLMSSLNDSRMVTELFCFATQGQCLPDELRISSAGFWCP